MGCRLKESPQAGSRGARTSEGEGEGPAGAAEAQEPRSVALAQAGARDLVDSEFVFARADELPVVGRGGGAGQRGAPLRMVLKASAGAGVWGFSFSPRRRRRRRCRSRPARSTAGPRGPARMGQWRGAATRRWPLRGSTRRRRSRCRQRAAACGGGGRGERRVAALADVTDDSANMRSALQLSAARASRAPAATASPRRSRPPRRCRPFDSRRWPRSGIRPATRPCRDLGTRAPPGSGRMRPLRPGSGTAA